MTFPLLSCRIRRDPAAVIFDLGDNELSVKETRTATQSQLETTEAQTNTQVSTTQTLVPDTFVRLCKLKIFFFNDLICSCFALDT